MSALTITATVTDIAYQENDDLDYAIVTVDSTVSLSEEMVLELAQHALSFDLGCDLDRVQGWHGAVEMDGAGGTVNFSG